MNRMSGFFEGRRYRAALERLRRKLRAAQFEDVDGVFEAAMAAIGNSRLGAQGLYWAVVALLLNPSGNFLATQRLVRGWSIEETEGCLSKKLDRLSSSAGDWERYAVELLGADSTPPVSST